MTIDAEFKLFWDVRPYEINTQYEGKRSYIVPLGAIIPNFNGGGGGGAVDAYTKQQTDALLLKKADKVAISKVGYSNDYNDLDNKPTKLSDFNNDVGYVVPSDIETKVDETTQIIAGTGLSGGGNLSANRTLSVNYGTTAGTSAQGNDSRIINGQTAYTWGDHANAGYLTEHQSLDEFYNKGEVDSLLDSKVTKVTGKGLSSNDYTNIDKSKVDNIVTDGIGDKYLSDDGSYKVVSVNTDDFYTKVETNNLLDAKVDKKVGKGLSANDYTTLDKDKLSNIEEEATKNSSDSYLLDRVNHTGVQPISSVDGLQDELDSIPKDLNQLTDDDNLLFDKDYNSLTNKPTIPTNNNQLINGEEFIKDAPKDSKQYARKDGSWSEITGGGGGGVTETEVKSWISRNIAVNNAYGNGIAPPSASRSGSLAIGNSAIANSNRAIAIGINSNGFGVNGIAIGNSARASDGDSVAIGDAANASSYYAVAIGANAVSAHSTISIGYRAGANSTTYTNCSHIGSSTDTTSSNQVQLGNSTTTTYAYGAVQDRSDVRDKADIRDIELGLDFINKLRPVEYKWDYREDYFRDIAPQRDDFEDDETYSQALEQARADFFKNPVKDGSKTRTRYHTGLIAQEVKQVMDDLGADFGGFQHHQEKGGLDVMSLGYNELIAVLIKAVQELSEKIDAK